MGYLGNPAGFTGTQANKRISVSATADQTAFVISGGYQVNQIDVYRNGVKLSGGSDFTAIDGSTVTLLQGATNGDNIEFVIFENFDVADALGTSGEQILNGNLTVSNGSITGNLVGIVTGDVTGNVSGTAGTFTGHVSATQGFSGNISGTAATFTGDVTIGGVLTYDDVTNIDSVGLITARNGLQVLAGIATIAGQANLANVNVSAASTFATLNVTGQSSLANANVSAAATIAGQTTLSNVNVATGIATVAGQTTLSNVNVATGVATVAGQTSLANVSVSAGSTFTGRISVNAGFANTGPLQERVNVVGNKLSAATNINLSDSNVHYFTTNETTTATPNLRWDGSTTLTSKMSLGDTIAVTLISKPNNAGYYAQLTIDGGAVTEEWNGGSAPSSANSDGYDVLTYQIVKIGTSGTPNSDFLVLADVTNFT